MQISLALIIYRSNSSFAKKTALQCEKLLKIKNINSLKISSNFNQNSLNHILERKIPDLAIILGGDGTVLKSANELLDFKIPILSFNVGGHLGFLTQNNEFLFNESFIDLLLKNEFEFDSRNMLECSLFKKTSKEQYSKKKKYFALNDFYFKSIEDEISSTNKIRIEIDKEVVNDYKGDGLIISSPTGSTAYSMAAGGPIVHPKIKALIISPICPVSLSNRPIIVPNTSKIVVKNINQQNRAIQLWKDGMKCEAFNQYEYCEIKQSSEITKTIVLKNNMTYYSTLIQKLEWKGDLSKTNIKNV